jgi:hypothetical protein
MEISNFLKKFKKVKTTSLVKTIEIDPFLYWKRILVIMFLVLIVVCIVSLGVYLGLSRNYFIDSKSKDAVKNLENIDLKVDQLNLLVEDFEGRALKRKEIIESKSTISDPSLKFVPVTTTNSALPATVQKP